MSGDAAEPRKRARLSRAQIEESIGIGRVEDEQDIEKSAGQRPAFCGHQCSQQSHVVDQHKEQPDADRDAAGRAPLAGKRARYIADSNEYHAEQD
ncbi:hypothetical protein D3C80_1433360 [compost metagenome]